VAVRAQQLQVLDPVVVADTVDVMQRERQRQIPPGVDATQLAPGLLQTGGDQAESEMHPIAFADKQLSDRHGVRARHDRSSSSGAVPRLAREAEALLARGDAVAEVVVALDLDPVVPSREARVRCDPQPPKVVADGRRRYADPPGDLGRAQALRVKLSDLCPAHERMFAGGPDGAAEQGLEPQIRVPETRVLPITPLRTGRECRIAAR
jgi:hypothetical protein